MMSMGNMDDMMSIGEYDEYERTWMNMMSMSMGNMDEYEYRRI